MMKNAVNIKSIKTKNNTSNGWSMLATAILKSAVRDGDVEFFENEWGEIIHEIANINNTISLNKLKDIAYDVYNNKYSKFVVGE